MRYARLGPLPSFSARWRPLRTLLALVAVVMGCQDGTTPPITPPPGGKQPASRATVRITPRSAVLDQLDTLRFQAVVTDSAGHALGGPVSWTVNAPGILQVDSTGLARTGAATGAVLLVGTALGGADTVAVTVRPPIPPHVWPDTNVLLVGTTRSLAARRWDADRGRLTIFSGAAWSSSDDAIARVDSTGAVVAVGPGVATISATLPVGRASAIVQVPASTGAPLRFSALATGDGYTCGLATTGATYCWGSLWYVLATSTYTDRCESISPASPSSKTPQPDVRATTRCAAVPLLVERAPRFVSLTAGAPCGLTAEGVLYCWGIDLTGVHNGPLVVTTTPTAVPGVPALRSAAGSCGVRADGDAVICWGSSLSEPLFSSTAAAPPPAGTWASLAAGGHLCGLTTDGIVACRGLNYAGQLGIGTVQDNSCFMITTDGPCTVFQPASTEERFVEVGVGVDASCARRADGAIFCWGYGLNAGLPSKPDGAPQNWPVPVKLTIAEPLGSLRMAGRRSCGVAASGTAYCWGLDVGSQFPRAFFPELRFSQIAPGPYHTCGIAVDGLAYCGATGNAPVTGSGVLSFVGSPPWSTLVRVARQ